MKAYIVEIEAAKFSDRKSFPQMKIAIVRAVTRIVGPDEYVYEMYMGLPDGKEFKSMEARYVRKK